MDDAVIIGFTGSRKGMSEAQKIMLIHILHERIRYPGVTGFVHGGAVGCDEQADQIASDMRIPVFVRPCSNDRCLYWIEKDDGVVRVIHNPAEPLKRNREIVGSVRQMIATPFQMKELQRSGTWMTIRHSRRQGVPLTIIYPDGSIGQ